MRGISLIAYKMPFASVFGSESYRCDARHKVDERNEKNSQSRTRRVRVRWVAHPAIEGQRAGFPLLRTRARACGALLFYLSDNFVISPGRFSIEGFGVSFVFFGTGTRRLVRPVRS